MADVCGSSAETIRLRTHRSDIGGSVAPADSCGCCAAVAGAAYARCGLQARSHLGSCLIRGRISTVINAIRTNEQSMQTTGPQSRIQFLTSAESHIAATDAPHALWWEASIRGRFAQRDALS